LILHTLEHSRTNQIKCVVSQIQPGVFSQLVEAYVRSLSNVQRQEYTQKRHGDLMHLIIFLKKGKQAKYDTEEIKKNSVAESNAVQY
jgi:hypothetical protein